MKTVYPKEPAQSFNDWAQYIREQINLIKSK
jgi:hypothetical protein